VAGRRQIGISVSLTGFVALTLISNGAGCANHSLSLHPYSLREYLAGRTLEVSVLGLKLREARRQLISGAFATGLLIVAVRNESPAAKAGLAALQELPRKRLLVGFQGGDLIIAVDGSRVRSLLDFANEIREAQPGEIVYLTIVRAGIRKQIPICIPDNVAEAN
jgi:S1-C subfamily serine protease